MIKNILEMLRGTYLRTESVKIAMGKNKFPNDIKELKNYIKLNT